MRAFNIFLTVVVPLAFTVSVTALAGEPKPITVTVGGEFEIALESLGGRNSQWLLSKPLDEGRLKQCDREYRRPATRKNQGGNCEVLRFKALSEGKTQIHLKYAPLLAGKSVPVRQTNFVVVITKAAAQLK